MMMRLIITVLFSFAFTYLGAQNRNRFKWRLEIQSMRDTLATPGMILGRTVGAGGVETVAHKTFKRLVVSASIEELKALTRDKNVVVKDYAFWALVLRDKKEAQLIRPKFKFSFKKVNLLLYGCIGDRCKLKDFVNFIYNLPDDQMEFIYRQGD